MKKLWQAFSYLIYRSKAVTRYKIHSPFVYQLVNEVFRDKEKFTDFSRLNRIHKRYAKRVDRIETMDFGSGSGGKEFKVKITSVGKIVKKRTHSQKQLEFLYRMAQYFKPATILEFGTAAGISTNYLAMGSPTSRLITMEGCMGLASVAEKNFKKRELKVELEVGEFDAIIDHVLEGIDQLDMVFVDGNHRKKPTIDYFEKCAKLATENSVFMFDDIHWSPGMQSAWNTIKKDKRVSVTIDLFWVGLVFFKTDITKQDFVVRY